MLVFLHVSKDGKGKVNLSEFSRKMLDLSIEVDSVLSSEVESYLKRNFPHAIILEDVDDIRDNMKKIFVDEEIASIPVFVFEKKSLLGTSCDTVDNCYGKIQIPVKINDIYMISRVAKLYKSYLERKKFIYIDELTGLYGNALFRRRVSEMISSVTRRSGKLSLVLFEIDYFKKISTTVEVLIREKILKFVGRSISDSVRHEDFVARLYDDRFALLVEENKEGANALVRRLLAIINGMEMEAEEKIPIDITAGVAVYKNEIGDDEDVFINLAEIALIYAKNKRRKGVAFSTEVIDIIEDGEDEASGE